MPTEINNLNPGLYGAGFVVSEVISAVEGMFGASLGVDVNVVFNVRDQFRNVVRGIAITVSFDGAVQPEFGIAIFDPTVLYAAKLPEGKVITVTTSGGRYTPASDVFTLEPAGFHRVDFILALPNAYAFATRRHYR